MNQTTAPASLANGDRLWLSLASGARAGGGSGSSTPVEIAAAISANRGREDYERTVLGRLLGIARELGRTIPEETSGSEAAGDLGSRLSDVIVALEDLTLERLLLFAGTPGERLEAAWDLSRSAKPEALVAIARAAAAVLDEEVSDWQVRLLTKLARLSAQGVGPERTRANREVRVVVREIFRQWLIEHPTVDGYDRALLRIQPPTGAAAESATIAAVDAERVLQTCLEIGECGQVAIRSLQALQVQGELTRAIDILDRAPIEGKALERLWKPIASAATVDSLLAINPPDFERLDIVLPRVGTDAAESMLRVLSDCESRSVRRRLFDRLVVFGSSLLPLIMDRLEDERWFVKRNMLALLQELGIWPEGIVATDQFLTHEHPSVRREAVKLFLSVPGERESALRAALRDEDQSISTLGLAAAEEACPAWAVPRLASLLARPQLDPADRLSAIRALGASDQEAALAALLSVTMARGLRVFRRRLVNTSPELILALEIIARNWSSDPSSRKVLNLAKASEDQTVREAVRSHGDDG